MADKTVVLGPRLVGACPMQRGHADGLAGALLPTLAVIDQAAVGLGLQLGL